MDSMVEKITEDHESPEIQPEENQTNKPRENPLKKIDNISLAPMHHLMCEAIEETKKEDKNPQQE